MTTDREADEALAKAMIRLFHGQVPWVGFDKIAEAARLAGWVPLTEVEEALRETLPQARLWYADDPFAFVADLVASLGRKP